MRVWSSQRPRRPPVILPSWFTPLYTPLPRRTVLTWGHCTNDGVWLLRRSHKASAVLSLWSLSGRSQGSHHEDPQSALWGGSSTSQGMEGHPGNSQHQRANHASEPSWGGPSRPVSVKPSGGCSPGWHADCILMRPWAGTIQLTHSQTPDPQKLGKIINVYGCFKPLSFRIICYSNRINRRYILKGNGIILAVAALEYDCSRRGSRVIFPSAS